MNLNPSFDPFDTLIELNSRLQLLERAHNRMAHAYQQTEQDLSLALDAIKQLQLHIITMESRNKLDK